MRHRACALPFLAGDGRVARLLRRGILGAVLFAVGLAAAPVQPPAGWRAQPKVAEQAWGEPSIGVFGVILTVATDERIGAGDAIAGFRDAAAAAGIELDEPEQRGPAWTAPIRRGRFRGTAHLQISERALVMRACFFTERRPEQAEPACAAFLESP
jgi:hypothetical protein